MPITKLHLKVLRECDRVFADRMTFLDLCQCVEKLEDYSFLKTIKNKKDPKLTTVKLEVDLGELE